MTARKEKEIETYMDKGWNPYASTLLVPQIYKQVISFRFVMPKMETVIHAAMGSY